MSARKVAFRRGVYLEIKDGRDGTTEEVLELFCKLAARGVHTGSTQSCGGPMRFYYGFIDDEAWPDVEAILRRRGRL